MQHVVCRLCGARPEQQAEQFDLPVFGLPACPSSTTGCENAGRCIRLTVAQRQGAWVKSPCSGVPMNASSMAWSPRLNHCCMKWVCSMDCPAKGETRLTLPLAWCGDPVNQVMPGHVVHLIEDHLPVRFVGVQIQVKFGLFHELAGCLQTYAWVFLLNVFRVFIDAL